MADGALGATFKVTRALQAACMIAIIGMTSNFVSQIVAANSVPPPVLVGTLSVVSYFGWYPFRSTQVTNGARPGLHRRSLLCHHIHPVSRQPLTIPCRHNCGQLVPDRTDHRRGCGGQTTILPQLHHRRSASQSELERLVHLGAGQQHNQWQPCQLRRMDRRQQIDLLGNEEHLGSEHCIVVSLWRTSHAQIFRLTRRSILFTLSATMTICLWKRAKQVGSFSKGEA